MKNLTNEKVKEILDHSDLNEYNLVYIVIDDADENDPKDVEILIEVLKRLDSFKRASWISRIFYKLSDSSCITSDQIFDALFELDRSAYYHNCLDAICKFCLAHDCIIDYWHEDFDRNLFMTNLNMKFIGHRNAMKEYFLKHPVPLPVFERWTRNSTNIYDSPFWLAVFYAANGNTEYIYYMDTISKYYSNTIIDYYRACRSELLNFSDKHIVTILNNISMLYSKIGKLYKNNKYAIIGGCIECFYLSLGLTEEIINKLMLFIIEKNFNLRMLTKLIKICKVCGFNIYNDVYSRLLNEIDFTQIDNHAIKYKLNGLLLDGLKEIDVDPINGHDLNALVDGLKLIKDKDSSFVTKAIADFFKRNRALYDLGRIIPYDAELAKELLADANSPSDIYDVLYCFRYKVGYSIDIPYDILEKVIVENENPMVSYEYTVGNILTSYEKGMIDKDVMARWAESDNKHLHYIGKSYLYHMDTRFDYTNKWGLLFNEENPDRDISIDSDTVIVKDGIFDSKIYGVIPDDAMIRECRNGSYRTNKFRVTDIESPFGEITFARHNTSFVYRIGDTIEILDFDPTNELGPGIYFDLDDEEEES